MTTATAPAAPATTVASTIARIQVLQSETVNLMKQAVEIRQFMDKANQELSQLQASIFGGATATVLPTSAPVVTAPPAAKGKRGPKSKSGDATAKGGHANAKSLRTIVFEVLSRPENAAGLFAADVANVITKEKLWTSSSDNADGMIGQQVYKLKGEGKLNRSDDKKYSVIPGVSL